MNYQNRLKYRLALVLCLILAAAVSVQGAMAAGTAEPTGLCTNAENEGIEYFVPVTVLAEDANDWRTDLLAEVNTRPGGTGSDAGAVIAMEVEVANGAGRYQCTEIAPGTAIFSCNSMPTNSLITGVYFRYQPDTSAVTEDTNIRFVVSTVTNGKTLLQSNAVVKFPPYPCARNEYTRDFIAFPGEALIHNTSDECTGEHDQVSFYEKEIVQTSPFEQDNTFAIVNIIPGDSIVGDRIQMEVSPVVTYDYILNLWFRDAQDQDYYVEYTYDYTPGGTPAYTVNIDASDLDGLTQSELPLRLVGGWFDGSDVPGGFNAELTDLWGNPDFPTHTDFNIKFWYENTAGTLGYENSVFHFERNVDVQFAPYCSGDATAAVMTGIATAPYDPCQSKKQIFNIDLTDTFGKMGIVVPFNQTDCAASPSCADVYSVYVTDTSANPVPKNTTDYRFVTRKCTDAACASYTTTNAYPHTLIVSNSDTMYNSIKNKSNSSGSTTVFAMRAHGNSALNRPFAIVGTRFVAEEPGTYVVFGFLENNDIKAKDFSKYAVKFYVTINQKDELNTCSTLANNGYFRAYWNDCLDSDKTQLLTFEHIPGTEEAWIQNRSNHGVHFPYVSEWSYLPQKLEVASLTCHAESLGAGGQPGAAYCRPNDVYVPPYTKVTITGGTMYLASSPKSDEYYVAYARRETYNISHLFFTVTIKDCENVKKIPNTGISLRSPLRVNTKVDEATSYAWTGNKLRIPAIGLGMEYPLEIVRVYPPEGKTAADLEWDLSTLPKSVVGELEGGGFLPDAGNSVLTGHYCSDPYQCVFANLEHVQLEDEIIIFGNDGIKYVYQVAQKFITQPTDVYAMFQPLGERSLTLVTCENYNLNTDEYERRWIFRCTLKYQEPYDANAF